MRSSRNEASASQFLQRNPGRTFLGKRRYTGKNAANAVNLQAKRR